jgi:type VI secretion system secreted protein VgrG
MNLAKALEAARSAALKAPVEMISKCPNPRLDWIEIVLKDDQGNAMPGEEYLVVAPDGERHFGQLDENGFARIAELPPGECKVSFPRIDKREWSTPTQSG